MRCTPRQDAACNAAAAQLGQRGHSWGSAAQRGPARHAPTDRRGAAAGERAGLMAERASAVSQSVSDAVLGSLLGIRLGTLVEVVNYAQWDAQV